MLGAADICEQKQKYKWALHVEHTVTISRHFDPKRFTISTFVRRKKQQYITVGTVKIFIETSAKH